MKETIYYGSREKRMNFVYSELKVLCELSTFILGYTCLQWTKSTLWTKYIIHWSTQVYSELKVLCERCTFTLEYTCLQWTESTMWTMYILHWSTHVYSELKVLCEPCTFYTEVHMFTDTCELKVLCELCTFYTDEHMFTVNWNCFVNYVLFTLRYTWY